MFFKSTELKLKESVVWKEQVGGSILILDLECKEDNFLELEAGAATETFLKLIKGKPKKKIVEELFSKYDVAESKIEDDIEALIKDLAGHDLLKVEQEK